jgi:hypothetical protein
VSSVFSLLARFREQGAGQRRRGLTFLLERPTADYTMVCNAVLRDRSISLRGKGLYALVFSKPSAWIFHEKALPAESTEGRDALRAAMKELLTARWVQKCQPREGGKFGGDYIPHAHDR